MERVLVFIEGWGCREEHKRHHCRAITKDRLGRDVVIKFWRNYNRGNKILPIDDDRASAIAVLVEYLRGSYTHGIVITKDMRVWVLFRKYLTPPRLCGGFPRGLGGYLPFGGGYLVVLHNKGQLVSY